MLRSAIKVSVPVSAYTSLVAANATDIVVKIAIFAIIAIVARVAIFAIIAIVARIANVA